MADQKEMKAALDAYVERFNAGDIDGLVKLFAEDATVEDPMGTPPQQGHDAIRAFYGNAIGTGSKLTKVAPSRGSHGNAAVLVFQVKVGPGTIDVADVFTFDNANRFATMTAYWGEDDFKQA